jgi:uncharacterized protein (TIGR01777 family)
MRILVSGAGGLLGRAFVADARARGDEVVALVRRPARGPDEIAWDPALDALDAPALEGFDAALHLSGAGIADARWTPGRRRTLRESRVRSTRLLAGALASRARRPRVLVSASAVGWYGNRGEVWLDETSAPGTGFLAELGREWESAAAPAAAAGIRVAHPRTGIVLDAHGGALARMLPLFRLGLGGPLGTGRQWWSWISLRDWVGALRHAIANEAVRGPFNAVAPEPETCGAFARALGRALGRPAVVPAPAFALRLVLGRELADEVLLASQRARPAVLQRTGFAFRDLELEPALRALLGRERRALA